MTTVLILGATGYLGGSFLVALKRAHPSLKITALVRSSSHFPAISAAGATPIQGDFSEHDKLADLAEQADIVINAAEADDIKVTEALLRGSKKRRDDGKGVGALVHVSGTAVFIQGSSGRWEDGLKAWDDLSEDDIKAITTSMFHGQVDVPLLQASANGHVNAYILCPSVVHGPGLGPVGRASFFYKLYINAILNAKGPAVVGEGTNRFEFVHIDDLVSLFLLIFAHALSSLTSTPTPALTAYQRYFIGSSRSTDWRTIARIVGRALEKSDSAKVKETITSFETRSVQADEIGWLGGYMASNTYTRPGRGRSLGWDPKGPGFEETVDGDVEEFLETL